MTAVAERTAITLDVDWAPDHAIDDVAAALIDARVAATWFVTHASPAIDRLREHPELFELGIHPNFLRGSTHGTGPDAVLDHCMALVPEARSMRTHGLAQSSGLLSRTRARTPIEIDASLFLPHARAVEALAYPLATGTLTRVPFIWEDDAEMYRDSPDWDAWAIANRVSGLAVFNFHPIHVVLNSADMGPYESLKQKGIGEATREDVAGLRTTHTGAGTAFAGLVYALAGSRGRLVSELAKAAP